MKPVDISLPAEAEIFNYLYPEMDFDDLDQDVMTVRLPTGYFIDVGWYPEHDQNGRFVIRVFWQFWDRQILTNPITTKSQSEVVRIVEKLAEHFSMPQIILSRSGSSLVQV